VEYVRAVHPERLGGIIGIVALLCDRHPDWAWQRQAAATYEALKRAQSSAYIYVVREDFADFDPDTPAYPKIYKRAARATGAAVLSAHLRKITRENFK